LAFKEEVNDMPIEEHLDQFGKLLKKSDLQKIESEEQALHLLLERKVSEDTDRIGHDKLTLGERVSDKVAAVAGSWGFILSFIFILAIWIVLNSIALWGSVDPYPFILLNLILSCVAALQAPIIMMSQNRQDAKDRLRSENDYKVNLKAEIILEDLHRKIDTLLVKQAENGKRIAEIEKKMESRTQATRKE
jgi:uncharacterized membrane protein